MNTNDLRKQKTSYYQWQKLRLEALLAFVERKEEFYNIMRKAKSEDDAKEIIATRFNISLRQVYYLFGLELRCANSFEYEELQKEYEKILCYCQILGLNDKNL